MKLVQALSHDQLPDDVDLAVAKLVPAIHASSDLVPLKGNCGVRVWVKVPMVDGASLTFRVQRRANEFSKWQDILGGQAISRTVNGQLLKKGAAPYYGMAVDPIDFIPGAEFQFVIDEAIEGPWSYSLELSV